MRKPIDQIARRPKRAPWMLIVFVVVIVAVLATLSRLVSNVFAPLTGG